MELHYCRFPARRTAAQRAGSRERCFFKGSKLQLLFPADANAEERLAEVKCRTEAFLEQLRSQRLPHSFELPDGEITSGALLGRKNYLQLITELRAIQKRLQQAEQTPISALPPSGYQKATQNDGQQARREVVDSGTETPAWQAASFKACARDVQQQTDQIPALQSSACDSSAQTSTGVLKPMPHGSEPTSDGFSGQDIQPCPKSFIKQEITSWQGNAQADQTEQLKTLDCQGEQLKMVEDRSASKESDAGAKAFSSDAAASQANTTLALPVRSQQFTSTVKDDRQLVALHQSNAYMLNAFPTEQYISLKAKERISEQILDQAITATLEQYLQLLAAELQQALGQEAFGADRTL